MIITSVKKFLIFVKSFFFLQWLKLFKNFGHLCLPPRFQGNGIWGHLRNKTCFPCFHSLVKTEANVWENSRADQWKPETQPAREFSQTLPRFSTGYGGTDNMFYFFYKSIIFIVNKKKDDIRSAYCKFSQVGDSQTTWLTSFSCFIALWKHNQNARTIQIIL